MGGTDHVPPCDGVLHRSGLDGRPGVPIGLGAAGCVPGPQPTVLLATSFSLDAAWTHLDPPEPNVAPNRFDASFKPTAVGKLIRVTVSCTKLDSRIGMKVLDGDGNMVVYLINDQSNTSIGTFTSASTNDHNVIVWEVVNPGGQAYGILVTQDP